MQLRRGGWQHSRPLLLYWLVACGVDEVIGSDSPDTSTCMLYEEIFFGLKNVEYRDCVKSKETRQG